MIARLSVLLALLACAPPAEPPKAAPVTPTTPTTPPMPMDMPMDMPMAGMPGSPPVNGMPMTGQSSTIPGSYSGIIGELLVRITAVNGMLAAGKLEAIPPHAVAIRELALAAPSRAPGKETVTQKASDLKQHVEALQARAEAGDAAGAQAAFEAVSTDVGALAAVK